MELVNRTYHQDIIMLMTSTTETIFLTSELLKQGYRYHKLRKAFSKFYDRHSELIVKYV